MLGVCRGQCKGHLLTACCIDSGIRRTDVLPVLNEEHLFGFSPEDESSAEMSSGAELCRSGGVSGSM